MFNSRIRRHHTFALASLAAIALVTACNTNPVGNTPGTTIRPVGIYVSTAGNSVLAFALDAADNAAPIRTIRGPSTGLNLPLGMAMDSKSNLFVANRKAGTVTVYAGDAADDAAPIRTLTAPNMGSPQAIAIGPSDDVFVVTCPTCGVGNGGQTGIWHFNNNADASDYHIGGETNQNTGLVTPVGIALISDPSNPGIGPNVVVANAFGGKVVVFAPFTPGDQFPIRTLSPRSGANVQSLAIGGNTLALSIPGAVVDFYAPTAATNAPPAATIQSSPDKLPVQYPAGIAIDATVTPPVGYLADVNGDSVYVIHTVGVQPALAVDAVTKISGDHTKMDSPLGILVVK